MLINKFTPTYNQQNFNGRKKEVINQSLEAINKDKQLMKRLIYTSTGFLVGLNMLAPQIYATFDDSPRVKSEQVNFDSKKDANDYAVKKIVRALKSEHPYEYLVYIDDTNNDILGEYKGSKGEVFGNLTYFDYLRTRLPGINYSVIHGHPTDSLYSTPISFPDFIVLNEKSAIKKVSAININGEYSSLTKSDNYKQIDNDKICDMVNHLWNELIIQSKQQMPEKWKQIDVNNEFSVKELVCKYQKTLEGIKFIHNYWTKNAPKLNLVYETNYSYLK